MDARGPILQFFSKILENFGNLAGHFGQPRSTCRAGLEGCSIQGHALTLRESMSDLAHT
jgi:hypothetical protein